jgi:hypothetical protein
MENNKNMGQESGNSDTENAEERVTAVECTEQVRLAARRIALLYHFFADTLTSELGEEKGKELIQKAIQAYGVHSGRMMRQELEALGLPPTPGNQGRVSDLPRFGWDTDHTVDAEGRQLPTVTYCPLAATWEALGPRAVELGRLYCHVDQAKQEGYNPLDEFLHTSNVLDGDPFCTFLVRARQKE